MSRGQQVVDAIAALGDSPDVDEVTRTLREFDVREIASALISHPLGGGADSAITVETFTVTAAEIIARWDGDLTQANIAVATFEVSDIVLQNFHTSTLNAGEATGGIYFAPAGWTTAQVASSAETSTSSYLVANIGAFAIQGTPNSGFLPTIITGACTGYQNIDDAQPATGAVTAYMLVVRAA